MARVPVSELPTQTTLTSADLLMAVISGVTSKIRYEDFLALLTFQPRDSNLDVLAAADRSPSSIGLSMLGVDAPTSASFLKAFGAAISWRTPTQVLGDIGAQAASANLTLFSSLQPTGYGGSFITMSNPLAVRYLKLIGDVDNTITQQTVAELAADIRPWLIPPTIAKTVSVGSAGTFTPVLATGEVSALTAQTGGAFTVGPPTGSPYEGQRLIIRLKDDGNIRNITWDAIYSTGTPALPSATVAGKTHYVEFVYNVDATKWDAIAVSQRN